MLFPVPGAHLVLDDEGDDAVGIDGLSACEPGVYFFGT
jgi:hypothetical protein